MIHALISNVLNHLKECALAVFEITDGYSKQNKLTKKVDQNEKFLLFKKNDEIWDVNLNGEHTLGKKL